MEGNGQDGKLCISEHLQWIPDPARELSAPERVTIPKPQFPLRAGGSHGPASWVCCEDELRLSM